MNSCHTTVGDLNHTTVGDLNSSSSAHRLFTDVSMAFANDQQVRLAVGQLELVRVKYGEKGRKANAFSCLWC
jgi:hypothetical protein